MMESRSGERTRLSAWLAAGMLALAVYALLYGRVFPEASIDFRVTSEEARARAASFLHDRGVAVERYRSAVDFEWAGGTKRFLEKEIGLAEANALMRERVFTWYYDCRFFVPGEREEYRVRCGTNGVIRGFTHSLADDSAAPALGPDSALALARQTLRETNQDPATLDLVESDEDTRPHRVDRTFTWEEKEFRPGNATYRRWVMLQGDRVGGFGEYLKVPEAWRRAEEERETPRRTLHRVASVFDALLSFAIFGALFWTIIKRQGRGRFALLLGLGVALLGALAQLNGWPFAWMAYDTTTSAAAFVIDWLTRLPFTAIASVIGLLLLLLPAEAIFRRAFPDRLSPAWLISPRYWRTREFVRGTLIGYAAGLIELGYVSLFYWLGRFVGVWSPLDVPAEKAVVTLMPWIHPLLIGVSAAIHEEFTYRVFAISLFMLWSGRSFIRRRVRLLSPTIDFLKRPWFALTAPAALWAALHVLYPQSPFFIRGLELLPVGVFWGWLFLRYGLIASLIAHCTYNALVSATPLMLAGHPWLRMSGCLVVVLLLLPLLPALLRRLRGLPLLSAADLVETPPAPAAVEETPVPEGSWKYEPLAAERRRRLVVLSLLALVALLAFQISLSDDDDPTRVPMNRWEAETAAREHLARQGLSLAGCRAVVTFIPAQDYWAERYAWELAGRAGWEEVRRRLEPPALWQVRFFRPLEKEEHLVEFTPQGEFFDYEHLLEETAPGEDLAEDSALARAEARLRASGLDPASLCLVDRSTEKRENRRDYWFTWEDSGQPVNEARFRCSVAVSGGEAHDFEKWFKEPEAWRREKRKREAKDALLAAASAGLGIGVSIFLLYVLVRTLIAGGFEWRRSLAYAGLALVLYVLDVTNSWPLYWRSYPTTRPVLAHAFFFWSGTLLGALSLFLTVFFFVTLARALIRRAFPNYPALGLWLRRRLPTPDGDETELRRGLERDAVFSGFAAGLLLSLMAGVFAHLEHRFSPWLMTRLGEESTPPAVSLPKGYTDFLPLLDLPGELALLAGAILAALAALAVYRLYIRRVWIIVLLGLAGMAIGAGLTARTLPGFLGIFANNLLWGGATLAIIWWICRRVLRDNLYAWVWLLLFIFLDDQARELLAVPDLFMRLNGAVVLALWLVLVAWSIRAVLRRPR